MIRYFVEAWNENKGRLEDYFRNANQIEYSDYETLLKLVVEKVFNGYLDIDFNEEVRTIDYGDYQGTLILTFAMGEYQPSEDETFYTVVSYGSCSGCDTLQAIAEYEWDTKPNEEQLEDYMTLCLHMVQNIKCFGDVDCNWRLNDLL